MTVTARGSALRGLADTHFAQQSYVAAQALEPGQERDGGVKPSFLPLPRAGEGRGEGAAVCEHLTIGVVDGVQCDGL
jgi:hypothetical protein